MLTKNIGQMKASAIQHIEADAVTQGEYWERDGNAVGGHGCFIGCLTHGRNAEDIESEFGMPLILVRLTESIFERLTPEAAAKFFGDIPEAIGKDGKDLSPVAWQFLASELRTLLHVVDTSRENMSKVVAGLDSLAAGGAFVDNPDTPPVDCDANHDAAAALSAAAAFITFRNATNAADAHVADAAADAADHAALAALSAAPSREAAREVVNRQAKTLLSLIAAAE